MTEPPISPHPGYFNDWIGVGGSPLEISRINFTSWALLQLNTKCLDAFVTMF